MKPNRARIGSLVLGLLLAWSSGPALAGNSRHITLRKDVILQGQPIPPGEYKLVWTPNGSPGELEVTVQRGKKVVARASAKRVEESVPSTDDSLVYSLANRAAQEIVEIRFAGAKEVVRIDPSAQAQR